MKLGQALSERARLQKRIGELRQRINENAATQEGTTAAEDANDLIEEASGVHEELAALIARINLTNARTQLNGRTITEVIAVRDQLAGRIATLRGAAEAASGTRTCRVTCAAS